MLFCKKFKTDRIRRNLWNLLFKNLFTNRAFNNNDNIIKVFVYKFVSEMSPNIVLEGIVGEGCIDR